MARKRGRTKEFHTKVVGVTHRNSDGTDRQRLLKKCKRRERLVLVRETNNPHDSNAVKVCRSNGGQLGYLSRDVANQIAERLDKGLDVIAEITSLTGGGLIFNRTRGCNIKITMQMLR